MKDRRGHVFFVLSDSADFLYKASAYYAPSGERSILWNDLTLGIRWPLDRSSVLSAKDAARTPFKLAEVYETL